jgi:hypothetical protein
MGRIWSSFGMLPVATTSSIAGSIGASRFSRRTVRGGLRQASGDRPFGPVLPVQPLRRPLDLDTLHRHAHEVLVKRAHVPVAYKTWGRD